MKKILYSFAFGIALLSSNPQPMKAQTTYTVATLTPEYKAVIQNVQTNCLLNDLQTGKFTKEYVNLVNAFNTNAVKFAGNTQQLNAENNKSLLAAGAKFRTFLNNVQFTKLTGMIKAGQLMPSNSTTTVSVPTTPTPAPTASTSPAVVTPTVTTPVSTSSNVAMLFKEISGSMKVTDQVSKAVSGVLTEYDAKAVQIKIANVNNPAALKSGMDALNKEYLVKLKSSGLSDEQIKQLVGAMIMQENILSGKNLSPQQNQLLNDIRTKYKLNDAQTMTVIFTLVEAKLRGDAIQKIAQTNKPLAQQQTVQLMSDLDAKLKSGLTPEQYNAIKADMEKLLKGGK